MKAWGQHLAHGASSSDDKESQKDTEATWNHHFQIPPNTSHYVEDVFFFGQENLWKTTWRSYERFECEFDCLVNFMNTSLRAAVYLGKHCYFWKTTGQLFRETEKLISGQTETTGISLIKFQDLRWVLTSLFALSSLTMFHCQSLCLLRLCALFGRKWGDNPVESWKKQIQWFSDNDYFSEL